LAGGLGATAFKELADDAEGKTAFQVGAACPENQSSVSPRHGASGVEKGRLADAGTTFDDQHSPTPGESPDRRQFGFALKEPGHIRDGRRLDRQLQCPLKRWRAPPRSPPYSAGSSARQREQPVAVNVLLGPELVDDRGSMLAAELGCHVNTDRNFSLIFLSW
jgi:hypothetical protein